MRSLDDDPTFPKLSTLAVLIRSLTIKCSSPCQRFARLTGESHEYKITRCRVFSEQEIYWLSQSMRNFNEIEIYYLLSSSAYSSTNNHQPVLCIPPIPSPLTSNIHYPYINIYLNQSSSSCKLINSCISLE